MGFVFRNDPCGVACVVVTFLLVLYADFVVVKVLVPSYETRYVLILRHSDVLAAKSMLSYSQSFLK